jgi:hypothetical protein
MKKGSFMSYTDYKQRWEFKDGEAYYIPQSKSYAEMLKGGLSISQLTHNYCQKEINLSNNWNDRRVHK